MHVEFRRQTYSWSLAELALDDRPGRGRRPLGGRGLGRRPRPSSWPCRAYSPAKVVFNLGARAAARLRRRRRPAGPAAAPTSPSPLAGSSWSLAVLVANLASAPLHDRPSRSSAPPAIPGPQLWREQLVPIAVVSPVVVSVGIIALLLSSLSAWAWLLVAPGAHRRRAAVPAVRAGRPRGQQRRAGLRLRPPGGAGLPGRGGHPADRRGGPRAAQRRAGGALAAALPRRGAAPGRLRRERRGLVRRPGRSDDVFRRRAVASTDGPAPGLAGARRRGGGARPWPAAGCPTCWAPRS